MSLVGRAALVFSTISTRSRENLLNHVGLGISVVLSVLPVLSIFLRGDVKVLERREGICLITIRFEDTAIDRCESRRCLF
jgi:hypothetical protein